MTDPFSESALARGSAQDLDAVGGEPEVSPVAKLHALLRGRYLLAIGLGAVLGVAGAAGGFLLPETTYTSRGLIEVSPSAKRILYRTDENGMIPMYDAYVSSQANFIRSRRVLDKAFESDRWRQVAGPASQAELAEFVRGVTVTAPPRSQVIEVAFTHTDSRVAQTAVEEVIKAFMELVDEREGHSDMSTRKVLENQRAITTTKLNEIRTEILAKSGDMGEEAVEARYSFAVTQLNELARLLHELDVELSAAGSDPADASDGTTKELTPLEIAVSDSRMDALLLEKARLEANVASMRQWMGDSRPELVAAQRDLAVTERHIEERRTAWLATQGTLPDGAHLTRQGKELHRARLAAMRDDREEEVRRLGKVRVELANLDTERSVLMQRLDDIKRRIDQISVESEVQSRITVISPGETPLGPDKDKRRLLAIVGGMGGMGLGVALIALYGLVGARMRHLDDVDARARRGRFLGILPEVDASAGGEAAGMADFCVHHVRAMIQLRRGDARRIVGVTSASAGAGKSTVAMALGVSFGGTGACTLLVDCDLVGHGLSTLQRSLVAAALRRSSGPAGSDGQWERGPSVLDIVGARAQSVSREELARLADEARRRTPDPDDRTAQWIRAAEHILAQEGTGGADRLPSPGVLDAMEGRPLEECVRETGIPGVAILPTGSARERDVGRFSMESVARLLAECSARYDVVVLDAGPVVGSIEASFALARSDDVLFVVPRGEAQSQVAEALARLDVIGANVSGIVFNRASVEDVQRSSYSSRSARSAEAVGTT